MNIGANYLIQKKDKKILRKYDFIYEILMKNKFLDTLKFPGKYCDIESLECFLDITTKLNCNIDIHGLPNMVPATHCSEFIKKVEFDKLPEKLWNNKRFKRFSTHIGLDGVDKVLNYTEERFKLNFKENQENIKKILKQKTKRQIDFGGENQPGGFGIDPITLTPEFISNIWQEMDFGVFDISHAKNAAKDMGISYNEYVQRLTSKDKVKILHISGNVDKTGKNTENPDKHILTDISEIQDILNTIENFKNLDLILSEYVYPTKYSIEKELIIEIVLLSTIVKFKNMQIIKAQLKDLESICEDLSNVNEILKKCKRREER